MHSNQLDSLVRDLASARSAALVAAAEFENNVGVWDVKSGSCIAKLDTIYDFGGRRLALSNDGRFCFTASYGRSSVACYDVATASRKWLQKVLLKTQFISLSRNGNHLYCGRDDAPCLVMATKDGSTLGKMSNLRRVEDSSYANLQFREPERHEDLGLYSTDGALKARIERTTFAVLSIAFSPNLLLVSESGGPVRCFTLGGTKLWSYLPKSGHHVLRLAYLEACEGYYGVEWPYRKGGSTTLIKFHPESGTILSRVSLSEAPDTTFVQNLCAVVNSEGYVHDVENGRIISKLKFRRSS